LYAAGAEMPFLHFSHGVQIRWPAEEPRVPLLSPFKIFRTYRCVDLRNCHERDECNDDTIRSH